MNVTIKNVKDAFKSNKEEMRIITFLENQQKIYGLNTTESIAQRKLKLKKTEKFLKSIKQNLNISITTLIDVLNKNLTGTKISLHRPINSNNHTYAVLNFVQSGVLSQYILAPITQIADNDFYVNLLDVLPSSLNLHHCDLFNAYSDINELFFTSLADTIRKTKKYEEDRLIDRMLRLQENSKDLKKIATLQSKIEQAHKDCEASNKTANDNLKISL